MQIFVFGGHLQFEKLNKVKKINNAVQKFQKGPPE